MRRGRLVAFAFRPRLLTPGLSGALDHVRWTAALAVCCSHLRTLLFPDYPFGAVPLKLFYFLTLFGNEAVVLFFVTSGLLVGGTIVKAVADDRFVVRAYAADRAARLYVVLVPAVALAEGLRRAGLAVSCAGPQGFATVASNLLFLQNFVAAPLCNNHPLWSLSSEAYFYLIGPALVLAALRRSVGAAGLSAALLLAGALVWTDSYTTPLFGLVLWLCGLVPWFVRVRLTAWLGVLPLAVVLLLSRGHWMQSEFGGDLALAATYTFALCCIWRREVPFAAAGRYLAGFSYSLYLVHMPLAQAAATLFVRPLSPQSPRSYLVFAAALTLIVSVAALFGGVFERRTGWLRGRLRRALRLYPSASRTNGGSAVEAPRR